MPLRPENKARYPANWSQISYAIREAAGWKCEWCAVRDAEIGARINGEWYAAQPSGSAPHDRPKAGMVSVCRRGDEIIERKTMRIVLTVAHLDHNPENCHPDNLRALCQQCHNRYDAANRATGRRIRKALKAGQIDLFERL